MNNHDINDNRSNTTSELGTMESHMMRSDFLNDDVDREQHGRIRNDVPNSSLLEDQNSHIDDGEEEVWITENSANGVIAIGVVSSVDKDEEFEMSEILATNLAEEEHKINRIRREVGECQISISSFIGHPEKVELKSHSTDPVNLKRVDARTEESPSFGVAILSNHLDDSKNLPLLTVSGSQSFEKDNTQKTTQKITKSGLIKSTSEDTEEQKSSSSRSIVSTSSGVDLDEKTRNHIISQSVFLHARKLRSSARSSRSISVSSLSDLEEQGTKILEHKISTPKNAPQSTVTGRPSDQKELPAVLTAVAARRRRSPEEKRQCRLNNFSASLSTSGKSLQHSQRTGDNRGPNTTSSEIHEIDESCQSEWMTASHPTTEDVHDFEAQVETEIYLPGAFAVSARHTSGRSSGYDSGFDENEENDDSCAAHDIQESSDSLFENPETTTPDSPLQAELYEERFAAAETLTDEHENEKYERQSRRFFQRFSVLGTILVLAGIISAVVTINTKPLRKVINDPSIPILFGWRKVGSLVGPTNQDNSLFGFSVAMSGNGTRLAIGLPGLDGENKNAAYKAGSVFIMDFNGTDWLENGYINGRGDPWSKAGTSVKLSADGKKIAIGCPGDGLRKVGYVSVYEEIDNGWLPVGEDIDGKDSSEDFGGSLAFSSDGNVLAVGAKYTGSDDEKEKNVGSISVFKFNSTAWISMGTPIHGESEDLFGWGVALSGNGKRLLGTALGASNYTGELRIFDYIDGFWVPSGSPIIGQTKSEYFGGAVDVSEDGETVVVGSPAYSAEGGERVKSGCVRIFQWSDGHDGDFWTKIGEVSGDKAFDRFGSSVALSSDGKIVAAGGPESDSFTQSGGHIRVFRLVGANLIAIGSELGDVSIGESGKFGTSVAISEHGKRLVGGAPLSDFDGFRSDVGRIIVYTIFNDNNNDYV